MHTKNILCFDIYEHYAHETQIKHFKKLNLALNLFYLPFPVTPTQIKLVPLAVHPCKK